MENRNKQAIPKSQAHRTNSIVSQRRGLEHVDWTHLASCMFQARSIKRNFLKSWRHI